MLMNRNDCGGKHKGIVSKKLFEKVQSILSDKRLISKFPLKVSHKRNSTKNDAM